jgi:integrase/recombinase XerD
MKDIIFRSVFADEIQAYLKYRQSAGYKTKSFLTKLRQFDRFCVQQEIKEPVFTRDCAATWILKKETEVSTTHYARINAIKHFLIFLSKKGYNVHITDDIRFKPTEFQPYIYSNDEIKRYFHAVDTYESARNRKSAIQYPVIFRLMYCCGTRINEVLGIHKKDVDLKDGVIKLYETKNDLVRYIVLGNDLKCLLGKYAEKCFYLLKEEDYIFTSYRDERLSGEAIYEVHRLFLQQADIPFLGEGKGPRVHDWRHTMAVRSFKQMIDSGIDMYACLPILSTYLGHKNIFATERYVRLTMDIYPYIEEKVRVKMEKVFGKEIAL